MFSILRQHNFHRHSVGATILIVFALSGCQLPSGKWSMGQNERGKSNDQGSRATEGIAGRETGSSKSIGTDESIDELMKNGDALRRNKQYEEARLVYQRARSLSPQNPDIHHRLAIIADKQKKYPVADQHYAAALKAKPDDVNLLSDLGYSYSMRGNPEKAEKMLKKALSIDATHKGAMANLGSLYAKQDRYSEAQELFRAGTTETEAQQYLSQLFPDRIRPEASAKSVRGRLAGADLIASQPFKDSSDLSSVSVEELQAEVERRKNSGKTGKSSVTSDLDRDFDSGTPEETVQVSWDTPVDPETDVDDIDAKPQGVPVPSGKTRQTAKSRKTDSHVQQARGQTAIASLDLIPSESGGGMTNPRSTNPRSSNTRSPSQRATEFGLNAGPGILFSIVPGIEMTKAKDSSKVTMDHAESMEDSSETTLTEGESLNPVSEVASEWDQTVTRRPSTIATAAPLPVAEATPLNSSSHSQPYQGLWPNSNQLPTQQSLESSPGLLTSEHPKTTSATPRRPARISSRSNWNDTTVGESELNTDAKQDRSEDPASTEDATETWPYASQR